MILIDFLWIEPVRTIFLQSFSSEIVSSELLSSRNLITNLRPLIVKKTNKQIFSYICKHNKKYIICGLSTICETKYLDCKLEAELGQ